MEHAILKQEALEAQQNTKLRNALVGEIELKNGKRTKVVILFNQSDIHFEEMNAGLNYTFSRCHNVHRTQNTFYGTSTGKIKSAAEFQQHTWNNQ